MPPRPLANCPGCGRTTLLVNATAVALLPAEGAVAEWYGTPPFGFLFNGATVSCNHTSCAWEGTLEEARA